MGKDDDRGGALVPPELEEDFRKLLAGPKNIVYRPKVQVPVFVFKAKAKRR